MPTDKALNRFIILPDFGFRSPILAQSQRLNTRGRFAVARRPSESPDGADEVNVLHSLHQDGPKLVEMTKEAELDLRAEMPGLKIVPLTTYERMRSQPRLEKMTSGVGIPSVRLHVVDATTTTPLQGVQVVAFTNFRHRVGADGMTDASGTATLDLAAGTKLDRLYVFGPNLYWGKLASSLALSASQTVGLQAIDLNRHSDALARYYAWLPVDTGAGVIVGVVDSGIQRDHPALPNVKDGRNEVFDELDLGNGAEDEWGPAAINGEHGTHVAGIIGMRPTSQASFRGVAPGATIRSYRVFPNSGGTATNYDIVNAIDSAISDGCDIINLSLGGGAADEAVRSAVIFAAQRGVLVVAAAGNDGRRPVSYPAAFPSCVAVSAMGMRGTFPGDSTEIGDIAKPHGKSGEFIAGFSNYGPQIAFTGPGTGIVSTVPNSSWAVMSGTSMACPAIAGFAAHILSQRADIRAMVGEDRTRNLRQALQLAAKQFGFGRPYEGFGLPH